ncbi:MAG: EAL domain-containing protein [Oscillospiraceae bacterium]
MQFNMKKHSMLYKILWPVMLLVVVQSALFAAAMLWGGTLAQMKENALDILNERVLSRKNNLENDLLHFSNLQETQNIITKKIDTLLLLEGKSYTDCVAGSELATKVIDNVADDIVYLLRKNSVTGAYIILSGNDLQAPKDKGTAEKSGFYVRDMDPLSTPNDKSDLLLERAPTKVAQRVGITTDIYWSPLFDLTKNDDYYFKPLQAAVAYTELTSENLGFWSGNMQLHPDDISVITYSVPLRAEDGKIFGVLGIDITADYMQKLMPYSELSRQNLSSYVIAIDKEAGIDKMSFAPYAASGSMYKRAFENMESIDFKQEALYRNIYETKSSNNEKVLASVQKFNLYNSNTPFAGDEWALIGMESQKDLYAFSADMSATIVMLFIVSIVMGILGAGFIAVSVTKPVTTLAMKVRTSDPHLPVNLPSIKVEEIDQLSGAIVQMSQDIARTSSRISSIIELSGIPVGVFEYTEGEKYVHCSAMFYTLTGLSPCGSGIAYDDFTDFLDDLYNKSELPHTRELYVSRITLYGKVRYLRVRIKRSANERLGVIMDVTQEMSEKRKIEYERDNDLLTSLLNRRAFAKFANEIFNDKQALKNAALLMMDLDNLKFVNDTYGHDCGDEYIRCAANVLRGLNNDKVMSARMSGDEFQVLFYRFNSKEEITLLIEEIRKQMFATEMILPDGKSYKVRASAGVAWYPNDADNLEALTQYADFAMYEVKNSVKGSIKSFDAEIYRRDSFLLKGREELNRLVEEELVDYAFQPIVDVKSGEVFAYEALMRPKIKSLNGPLEVIRLAHAQSKLYQIEKLTWFCALEAVRKREDLFCNCKVFVNSISNQLLNEEDLALFVEKYGDLFPSIIVELTEGEYAEKEYTKNKLTLLRNMNLPIALDDFGSGYNSDMAILDLKPDYIKIDMGIVRGIDKDLKRQEIFCNIASFSKQNDIKIIAEGVETQGEMRVIVENGADYIQGYYFGKPSLEPQKADEKAVQTLLSL